MKYLKIPHQLAFINTMKAQIDTKGKVIERGRLTNQEIKEYLQRKAPREIYS